MLVLKRWKSGVPMYFGLIQVSIIDCSDLITHDWHSRQLKLSLLTIDWQLHNPTEKKAAVCGVPFSTPRLKM